MAPIKNGNYFPCGNFIGRARQRGGSQALLRSKCLARGPWGLLICAGCAIRSPTPWNLRAARLHNFRGPAAVADRPLDVLGASRRRVDSTRRAAASKTAPSRAPRAPSGGRPSARTGLLRRRRRGSRSRRARRRRFVGVAARGSQDVGSPASASIGFAGVVVDRLGASARSVGTPAMILGPNSVGAAPFDRFQRRRAPGGSFRRL